MLAVAEGARRRLAGRRRRRGVRRRLPMRGLGLDEDGGFLRGLFFGDALALQAVRRATAPEPRGILEAASSSWDRSLACPGSQGHCRRSATQAQT
jgi:hypothetical protein